MGFNVFFIIHFFGNFIKSLRGFIRYFLIKSLRLRILFSMKVLRVILSVSFAFALLCVLGGGIFYFSVTAGVSLDPQKLCSTEQTVLLFDGEGKAMSGVSASSKREKARFHELPEHTKFAFVDVEDKRFFSHGGFDFLRMAKATLKNLASRSFKEGASTISQQLIKNTHLSQEKTIKRKLREIKLTAQLEKRYSKEEILENYLNTIYFGHDCFGITAAAKFYFGKEASELTLAESATLAGLVKSPNNFSPFKNPERCFARRKTVLNAMKAQGHVTEREWKEAANEPFPDKPHGDLTGKSYLRFVFDELESISERYSLPLGGRIEIHTFFDGGVQSELEKLGKDQPYDKTLTVLDKRTGGFKGCYSTVGEIRRLPGSTIKPLLVYAPAIEENFISPATPILDEKTDFGGYSPENYGREYSGYVSARDCLAKSLNVPAVKILNSVGVKKAAGYLARLGLRVDEEDESLALALGGMKNGFSLCELMRGYDALYGGEVQTVGFIREIKIDGQSVYRKAAKKERVFSKETAYLTTDMLKTAVKTGTAKKLRSLPFDVAAKTGTAGTREKNTDVYTLSYTVRDVVGVWFGNADNRAVDCTGGGLPCELSMRIHEYLYGEYKRSGSKIGGFEKPENVRTALLDKDEYYTTHNIVLADKNAPSSQTFSELFKKSAYPTKRADKFSNPSICTPQISVNGTDVTLRFDESAKFYDLRIDRYDYVRHTTVYEGNYQEVFNDCGLTRDKRYIYTVTPIYDGKRGSPVVLPEINLKKGEVSVEPPEILNKNWWEY